MYIFLPNLIEIHYVVWEMKYSYYGHTPIQQRALGPMFSTLKRILA